MSVLEIDEMNETAAQAAQRRQEEKLDRILENVGALDRKVQSVGDQQAADRRLQEELNKVTQQAITRLQGEMDQAAMRYEEALKGLAARHDAEMKTEVAARDQGDVGIRTTLSRIAFALFTALLATIGTVIAALLIGGHP